MSWEIRWCFLWEFCIRWVIYRKSSTGLGIHKRQKGYYLLSPPAPTASPGKIFITAASARSLLVSWNSVPEQHRHGNISQYNVYINLQNDSFTLHVFNSTQGYVDDLQVYTLYVIRVSAVNDIGEGPKSKAFTARTMARGRSMILVREWDTGYLQLIF